MWLDLGHPKSLVDEPWPKADEAAMRETSVEVAVQVNGKIRARVQVPSGADEAAHKAVALADPAVKPHIEGKTLVKAVIVPGRLINLVVK
jgi:leucyl-tRNA synthetase